MTDPASADVRQIRAQVEATMLAFGIKPTPQRVDIGALLLAGPCHRSADQILQALKNQGSHISKATVYNTLNLFSRHGMIREMAVDSARLLYDSTTTVHHHFYNEDTGELVDIDPALVDLGRLPPLPEGTEAAGVELLIRLRRKA